MQHSIRYIQYSILALILSIELCFCIPTMASSRNIAQPKDFNLEFKANKTTLFLGEQPTFTARITNNTDDEVLLVPALDGSSIGWRYPIIDIQVTKPKHAPETGAWGRCGIMNDITEKDFHKIPPGKSLELLNGWTSNPSNEFTATGTYTVQLTYATNAKAKKWHGFMAPLSPIYKSSIRRLVDKVPSMKVKSNVITITFVDKLSESKGSKEIIQN
jgi:hypothetical protein